MKKNITRLLTYTLPDKLFATTTELGKTSTHMYEGPEYLVLHIDKDSGRIADTWHPDEEPPVERLALNLYRVEFRPETDEDYIKIALLYCRWTPKKYEVDIGPEYWPNTIIADPTDITMVFEEFKIVDNYAAPLEFKQYLRDASDEVIRRRRNAALAQCDGRIAEDMPSSIKQAWLDYRQRLRDLPEIMIDVPNNFIKFPLSPDQEVDMDFNDPEVPVIMIADRTEADAVAISQLPDGVF